MKKILFVFICLSMILMAAGCSKTPDQVSAGPASASAVQPTQTLQPTQTQTAANPSPSTIVQTATAAKQESQPSNTAEIYSSYAHMVLFDPEKGWAEFDYFDMLKGEEAAQWLVDNKGYTLAQAQEEVSQYADSEFIEKNTNPQTRTIDLNSVSLRMMYYPDGTQVEGSGPVQTSMDDLRSLYAKDPELVLNSFFYYVKTDNGKAVSVDQVYWP